MLSHQGIHRRNPGDVDDGNLSFALHDVGEQVLHHQLSALTVESADQWKQNDPFPPLYERTVVKREPPLLPFISTGVESSSSSWAWHLTMSLRLCAHTSAV